jgi:hypothetical protein
MKNKTPMIKIAFVLVCFFVAIAAVVFIVMYYWLKIWIRLLVDKKFFIDYSSTDQRTYSLVYIFN